MFGYVRLLFDNFTLILLAVVAAATLLPAQGQGALFFDWLTVAAIALLFFMHGAKLSVDIPQLKAPLFSIIQEH